MNIHQLLSISARCAAAPAGRLRHRALAGRTRRAGRQGHQGLVPRPGHRQDRPPEPGPGAAGLLVRQAARRRPSPSASRPRRLHSVKWPAGGQYLGDWREGEKLAQNGRGMTWTDASRRPDGQRRQLLQLPPDRQEGDLLRHHRPEPVELRQDPRRQAISPRRPPRRSCSTPGSSCGTRKAYSACSNMPRFGHKSLLDEQQLRDIMALLLDPKSPVNQ